MNGISKETDIHQAQTINFAQCSKECHLNKINKNSETFSKNIKYFSPLKQPGDSTVSSRSLLTTPIQKTFAAVSLLRYKDCHQYTNNGAIYPY